jgi:hypothetical protein
MEVQKVKVPMLFVVPTCETLANGQKVYDYELKHYKEFAGHTQPEKRMIANLCNASLTQHMIIMRIVGFDQFGNRLSEDHWIEAYYTGLHSFDREMTPLWTQSGVKNGTFILVPTAIFAKLGRRFDLERDGYIFGAYIGLLFSDLAPLGVVRAPAVWTEPLYGEDGIGYISREEAIRAWGDANARQVRIIVLDDDGYPKLLGKGVLLPIAELDGATNPVRLNSTLVKWHSGVNANDEVLIAPTPVVDRPIKMGITWELLSMLKNTDEVHTVVREYAVKEAHKLCSMMSDDNRVPLLKRLGQLHIDRVTGTLVKSDRNILSLVRSAMPWCSEMEERLGRFSITELVGTIAPSGGVYGTAYMALQNDKYGARPCEWTDSVRCVVSRLPATSMDNVVPFSRVLRNGSVTSDVMRRLGGDSDGDFVIVISDPKIVDLFIRHHLDYHAGIKPEKKRGIAPVSRSFQIENAIQVHRDGGLIGRLTMVAHYLLMQGDYDASALCGNLAQAMPMLAKYPDMLVNGKPLREAVAPFLGIKVEGLHWRDMQKEARQCSSPRELGTLHIPEPKSIIDHAFNWMTAGVRKWADENPLKDLRLPQASSLAFKVHPMSDLRISQQDVEWRKKVVSLWGRYWQESYGKETSHAPWFQVIKALGAQAPLSRLVATLRWSPRRGGSGFALKYHLMGTRWEELVGLHPSVATWLEDTNEQTALDALAMPVAQAVADAEVARYF